MRMLISKMKLSKIFVDEEFINILFDNREIQEIDGEDFYFTELNEVIRNIFMSEEGKELGKEFFAREGRRLKKSKNIFYSLSLLTSLLGVIR